ncbi:MAG: SUMF1/EgtB/PvdO family nonheme iron enzyme [Polyangiaceae bacterium]|nr:SUMF1/EgtB/PvdO family nonheme iron enzyme [Polyangiaceae bacterium]
MRAPALLVSALLACAACDAPAPAPLARAPLAALASRASEIAARLRAQLAEAALAPPPLGDELPTTLEAQRARLFEVLRAHLDLPEAALAELRRIISGSPVISQGLPKVTRHPLSRSECIARRRAAGLADRRDRGRCGHPYMAPLFDPGRGQTESDATACIDRFEFPNVPCEYPVTWVSAREAALACTALGKRLCDAHEWEGACAGALRPVEDEYPFGNTRATMQLYHNRDREIRWAYGPKKDMSRCATDSTKSDGCVASGFTCGTNSYPAGSFPECVSPFGVYDQHGNVAEHMNLPRRRSELSGEGGMGETEMKGSWFIFARYEAHIDDCRWRAPSWHASRVMAAHSHLNYHLGFRCCATVK